MKQGARYIESQLSACTCIRELMFRFLPRPQGEGAGADGQPSLREPGPVRLTGPQHPPRKEVGEMTAQFPSDPGLSTSMPTATL